MFTEDLSRTLRACRAQPLLPLSAIGFQLAALAMLFLVALAGDRTRGRGLLLTVLETGAIAAFALLWLGFAGAQRVWYARLFRGERMPFGEVVRATRRLVGPFLLLGIQATVLGFILSVPLRPFSEELARAVPQFVVLALFTFATSAVAFGEDAGNAVGVSWRTIRAGWPRCAPHVLVPIPLTYALNDRPLAWLTLSPLLFLVARGVTTSYYVRVCTPPPAPREYGEQRDPAYFG